MFLIESMRMPRRKDFLNQSEQRSEAKCVEREQGSQSLQKHNTDDKEEASFDNKTKNTNPINPPINPKPKCELSTLYTT